MTQADIQEVETGLSRLIKMLETRQEEQILITRHGEPIVTMTLYARPVSPRRIGVARGKIVCPDDLDKYNDEIADMFEGFSNEETLTAIREGDEMLASGAGGKLTLC